VVASIILAFCWCNSRKFFRHLQTK